MAKKKILIIDDDSSLTDLCETAFGEEGFEVLVAPDGDQGLAMALDEHPDLILLDIVLPKLDGMQVLTKLREDDWGKEVPIFMLTNLANAENTAQALEKNVHEYLVKADWKIEDVVRKVKEKLEIT